MVFIIGETTRWDHMGILGYSRNTTPELEKEESRRLSRLLVRYRYQTVVTLHVCARGRAEDNPSGRSKQNVFAVLHQLGFSGNLYAMQSEMWFYSNDGQQYRLPRADWRRAAQPRQALTICCWWMR